MFWEVDEERDLITSIKYPESELSLSSSEIRMVTIWRHQYNDSIPIGNFLLCSFDYTRLQQMFEGIDKARLYHMLQESRE